MENSKRQVKYKAIYKFSPVNTSRSSIFPQTPFRGLRTPPSPQFHWHEIVWTATATLINFLDQTLKVLMIRLPKPVASMFSSVVFVAETCSTLIFLNPNLCVCVCVCVCVCG